MLPLVDTHCHLGHHFDLGVEEQLVRARTAGLRVMIDVGTDLDSSRAAVRNATEQPDVWAAVGIHPNDAGLATPAALEALAELAGSPRVVAVGETGMDTYRDTATPEEQERAFRAQIAIARQHDLALVIHCRDAWPATIAVLEDEGMVGASARVVLHCYSGDVATTQRTIGNGWFHSFAGNVTFSNAGALRDVAGMVPEHLLLTETDSPYLTPHPHRGAPNDPSFVALTLARLAEVRGTSAEALADAVLDATRRAFALDGPTRAAVGRTSVS
jgi:TatD DNase family protein